MKPQRTGATASILLSLLTPSAGSQPESTYRTFCNRVLGHCENDLLRQRMEQALSDLQVILNRLPIDRLSRVEAKQTRLELFFDWKEPPVVRIPNCHRKVFDEKRNRVVDFTTESRDIRVNPRLRFEVVDGGLRGRKGDIEVESFWGWTDLKATIETHAGKVIRDDRGRPYVCTDPAGDPKVDSTGQPILQRADRWLVFRACWQRVEFPLPLRF